MLTEESNDVITKHERRVSFVWWSERRHQWWMGPAVSLWLERHVHFAFNVTHECCIRYSYFVVILGLQRVMGVLMTGIAKGTLLIHLYLREVGHRQKWLCPSPTHHDCWSSALNCISPEYIFGHHDYNTQKFGFQLINFLSWSLVHVHT